MKLAEALILRADCQKRVEQLKARLVRSAKVQEGDQPAEDPRELIAEFERVSAELATLVQRINRTNSLARLGEGMTVSDALASRDVLSLKRSVYHELAQAASIVVNAYMRSEIRFKSTVNVAEIQNQVDGLSREYRELDARIQEANWMIELVE
jgi:hypothetical protein